MSKEKLGGIFSNPIVKGLAMNTFCSYLESSGNDGIYISRDAKGDISVKEFSENPQTEIEELQKLVEMQTKRIKVLTAFYNETKSKKHE